MSGTHLSAATEQLIEQRDQARTYAAQLEAELEQVRGRAQVAETELEAANELIHSVKQAAWANGRNPEARLAAVVRVLDGES